MSRDLWPSRAAREFTANQAEFDLVALNSSEGDPVWVARGKSKDLRPLLSPDLLRNILPKLVEAATYNGKYVAVPQYWNTEMYFYRKDLFGDPKNQADFKAKYGYDLAPPTTWDQVADIDEFFHRPPNLYGGWMSGVNWGIGLDYQTILFGLGGKAFDLQNNNLLANSPESVKAFEIMRRIAKTAPDSYSTQTFFDADKLMQGGQLASYTNYSYIWADADRFQNLLGSLDVGQPLSDNPDVPDCGLRPKVSHARSRQIGLDTAQDAINWFASCGYSFIKFALASPIALASDPLYASPGSGA